MSLTLTEDDYAPADADSMSGYLKNYDTPMGRYLGAKVGQGWFDSMIGQAATEFSLSPSGDPRIGARSQQQKTQTYLKQDEWEAGPHFREKLPFEEFMTDARARDRAEVFDDKTYRDWLISQRQNGVTGAVLGFGSAMLGGLPDPVNYIPFGAAGRIALAAKSTGVLGKRIVPAFLGNAVEAGAATALTEPVLIASLGQWGDDFTWEDVVTDIALGAATGGVIGGVVEGARAHVGLPASFEERTRGALPSSKPPVEAPTAEPIAGGLPQLAEEMSNPFLAASPDDVPQYKLPSLEPGSVGSVPLLPGLRSGLEEARLRHTEATLSAQIAALPTADEGARGTLARLRAVEAELSKDGITAEERRRLSQRRDELLTDTTPEKLTAQAAPAEQRRLLENQRREVRAQIDALAAERSGFTTERQHAKGADELNVTVSDLVQNREPHVSREASAPPPPPAVQTPSVPKIGREVLADVAESAKPAKTNAEGVTTPSARILSEAEEEVAALHRSGALPADVRAEYEAALAASQATEEGIDAGYARALTCLRNGELD